MAGKRILREIKTVTRIVQLYEQRHPAPADTPEHYRDLLAYAVKRLEKCRYGEDKPACKQCPVHCYQPKPREEMKVIMRWAGPRMLWHHPILAVRHLIDDKKPVPPLPQRRRSPRNNQA